MNRNSDKSFHVVQEDMAFFGNPQHCSTGYTLVLTLNARGERRVGDNRETLRQVDLVLIGPFLPHDWIYAGQAGDPVTVIILYFSADFLCHDLLDIPELDIFRYILKSSGRGLSFHGRTCDQIGAILPDMLTAGAIRRLSLLLMVFDVIGHTREYRTLASQLYRVVGRIASCRLREIGEYINRNLEKDIGLTDIAERANMSVTAFCQLFKEEFGNTFVGYVNEARIMRACRLLMLDKQNIAEISSSIGFNNLANFNRQFKKYRKMTPTEFRGQARRGIFLPEHRISIS